MKLPGHAFFRGRIVPYSEARVGVMTHALNYGTGCFAGLRGYWNDDEHELFVFRPRDHFKRFLESTRLLSMELPDTIEDLVGHMLEHLGHDGAVEHQPRRWPQQICRRSGSGTWLAGLTSRAGSGR